nr:translation initiation factor 5B [Paratrimastix eleionoma]
MPPKPAPKVAKKPASKASAKSKTAAKPKISAAALQIRAFQTKLKEREDVIKKKEDEEEQLRLIEEKKHEEELKKEEERKKKLKEKEKERKKKIKAKFGTPAQQRAAKKLEAARAAFMVHAAGLELPAGLLEKQKKENGEQPEESKDEENEKEEEEENGKEEEENEKEEEEEKKEGTEEKKEEEGAEEKEPEKEEEAEKEEEEQEEAAEDWEALLEKEEITPVISGGAVTPASDASSSSSEPQAAVVIPPPSSTTNPDASTTNPDAATSASVPLNAAPHKKVDRVQKNEEEREEESEEARAQRRKDVMARHKSRMTSILQTDGNTIRSPICCILGHVDTGKTSLLDKIRHTNVQEGEAGGITQQIGATFFPMSNLREQTKKLAKAEEKMKYEIPGLLVIDTPGHESFTNLRSRGSSLCNIAILVVDIMHGIEPQTEESIRLLQMRNTPFVVALNKIDRIYGWEPHPWAPFHESFDKQSEAVKTLFQQKFDEVKNEFANRGMNACLYNENKDYKNYISLVPTSAVTGEGVPDLLMLLIALTQFTLREELLLQSELTATVLEVKVIQGLGTTIDVVLSNGLLKEGDTIVVCGLNGPITTQVRALLTPQPCKELRVKGQYVQHHQITAAMGIKISAQGLENAIAGSPLHVAYDPEEVEFLQELVQDDLKGIMTSVKTEDVGVHVQSSTIGSLEALLAYLQQQKVPVGSIDIGPIYKKDIIRASIMLEKKREYACILGFDVTVAAEAQQVADEMGVKIFTADIIYHLTQKFDRYLEEIREETRQAKAAEVVFPCQLSIVPNCIFNRADPIVIGVRVMAGQLRIGTPLVVMTKEDIDIGNVGSIEFNHRQLELAVKDQEVAIKIVAKPSQTPRIVGRHFDEHDLICSKMSRRALDILKSDFRDQLKVEDWKLCAALKTHFNIL